MYNNLRVSLVPICRKISSLHVKIECNQIEKVTKFLLYLVEGDKVVLVAESKLNKFTVSSLIPNTRYVLIPQVEIELPKEKTILVPKDVSCEGSTELRTLKPHPYFHVISSQNLLDESISQTKNKLKILNHTNDLFYEKINILTLGEIGSGKSAFLTTLYSSVIGEYAPICLSADLDGDPVTKKITKFPVLGKTIHLYDSYGWNENYEFGDLSNILKGDGSKECPSDFSNEIHGVIFVVDIDTANDADVAKMYRKMNEEFVKHYIKPIVVLSKCDTFLEDHELNAGECLYNNSIILGQIETFSKLTSVEPERIFPMKNYTAPYIKPDKVIEFTALEILDKAVELTKSKFWNFRMETSFDKLYQDTMYQYSKDQLLQWIEDTFNETNSKELRKICEDHELDGESLIEIVENPIEFQKLFSELKIGVRMKLKKLGSRKKVFNNDFEGMNNFDLIKHQHDDYISWELDNTMQNIRIMKENTNRLINMVHCHNIKEILHKNNKYLNKIRQIEALNSKLEERNKKLAELVEQDNVERNEKMGEMKNISCYLSSIVIFIFQFFSNCHKWNSQ